MFEIKQNKLRNMFVYVYVFIYRVSYWADFVWIECEAGKYIADEYKTLIDS